MVEVTQFDCTPETSGDEVRELLTVDVWDTLLRRRCHPDSVKLYVCRYLLMRLERELALDWHDPWRLLEARQGAEKAIGEASVREGLDDEYGHMQVYRRWLDSVGLTPFPGGKIARDAFIGELDRVELDQEKYVSYPDPGIAATLGRTRARRVLFFSDFYMPASAIDALLAHHGIDHLVESGVVSCEVGLNKRSGRLFSHLHERFGISPADHAHIGDNLHADVQAPSRLGVRATHYLPDAEHALRRQREWAFSERESALRHAADMVPATTMGGSGHQDAYEFGRRLAPLFIGFALYLMERSIADRLDRLLFFTREGEFFIQVYRRLAAQRPLGLDAVHSDLLCVSRLATFAASLPAFTSEALMRLWSQYSQQSVGALLRSLGLSVSDFEDAALRHGLTLDEPVVYPWQDTRMLAFLGDAEVQAQTVAALATKRHALRRYLASLGLDGRPARVGIVDIGWRGTIQDNIAQFQPEVFWHGYYLGLNRYLNEQPVNVAKQAYGPDLNRSDTEARLLDFVAPIEMLCNSPNGSVTGYQVTANGVQVMRHIDADENSVFERYGRAFQQGVLDTVDYWADFIRTHAYSSAEFRPIALRLWDEAIRKPPPFLAEAYFRLNHNELFGVGGFLDKRQSPGTGQVLAALFPGAARQRLQCFLNETGWLPGLLASRELSLTFRAALRLYLAMRALRHVVRRHVG